MACTVYCPKCRETIKVRLVVENEDLPTSVPQLERTESGSQYNLPYDSPSLGRSGSSSYEEFEDLDRFPPTSIPLTHSANSDYEGFSDLDDIPSSPVLAHSVDSHYQGMGMGGRKKTRKRFNTHKKKLTKRRK